MKSNLKFRIISIVAVILVCIYGIIGLPKSTQELVDNWKKNIHLGLDLRGGVSWCCRSRLQDAFKTEADAVIQNLKDDLNKGSVEFTEMSRNDPQTIPDADKIEVDIKGVPSTKAGQLPHRSLTTTSGRSGRWCRSTRPTTG